MVLLQPLHVGLQGLGGLVPPPGIHGDSDSPGKLLVDASELRREERAVSASHQPGREPSTASTGCRLWRKAWHQLRDQQRVSWCIFVLKILLGLISAGGFPQRSKAQPLQDTFKLGYRQMFMSQLVDNSGSLNNGSSVKSGFFSNHLKQPLNNNYFVRLP